VVGIKLVLNIPTSMASANGALHRSYPSNAAINFCKHVMSTCARLGKADGQMFCYRTTLSGERLNAKAQIFCMMLVFRRV
jgi:hypothetical protein